jgi:hypothetical protein
MIPEAREVRLKPKIRKVLEARCRAPTTPQRDVKRARIVLLAAESRSTRSIAEEVGVQPRIVSNWRRRFADHGLGGPGLFNALFFGGIALTESAMQQVLQITL